MLPQNLRLLHFEAYEDSHRHAQMLGSMTQVLAIENIQLKFIEISESTACGEHQTDCSLATAVQTKPITKSSLTGFGMLCLHIDLHIDLDGELPLFSGNRLPRGSSLQDYIAAIKEICYLNSNSFSEPPYLRVSCSSNLQIGNPELYFMGRLHQIQVRYDGAFFDDPALLRKAHLELKIIDL